MAGEELMLQNPGCWLVTRVQGFPPGQHHPAKDPNRWAPSSPCAGWGRALGALQAMGVTPLWETRSSG